MKCYGAWYGGTSYASPQLPGDLEEFPTIDHAITVWYDRYKNYPSHYRGPFATPCVDESTEMLLWFTEPEGDLGSAAAPDRVIRFGPRRGIRVERV